MFGLPVWAALSAVPEAEQCGWCADEFGVSWQVVPGDLGERMVTPEAYRRNNVLRTEVSSADVARLLVEMAGPAFAKTTGAQVPVDGGNERVI